MPHEGRIVRICPVCGTTANTQLTPGEMEKHPVPWNLREFYKIGTCPGSGLPTITRRRRKQDAA